MAQEGRKVGSLKRRVRSQLATGAMKNCTPLWREAHFQVKSVKNWRSRTTFGGSDVEKVYAVVARSRFRSQNVQNTPCTNHFWRFRSRFTFHTTLQYITLHYNYNYNYNYNYTSRHSTTLHSTTPHYTTLHSSTLNYTTLHYITLHYTPLHYTSPTPTTTLHYTPLHHSTLHYTTLH